MAHLLNIFLVLFSLDTIWTKRVLDSPKLSDFSETKQSYVAWPANTPLSLKCKARGAEPMLVHWYKDGDLVKQTNTIFQDQKWNLKFRKPQLSDNGIYKCVVSNDHGVVEHSYSLRILQRIQSAPVLVEGYPKPVTARVGDSVELQCLEQPNGQVSDYRWLKTDSLVKNKPITGYAKDNVHMISPMKYESFEVDNEDYTTLHGVKLTLEQVTERDAGYYTCFLSNSNGFTHGTTYLNVTPISATDPPEFLAPKHKRLHFIVSPEEEDVKFSCLVRGGAPLDYQWYYNGHLLKSSEKRKIVGSELIVKRVHPFDVGVYTCVIKNDYGHVKHSFKLKVLARQSNHPVLLAGYPKDRTAVVGQSTSLYCAETTGKLVDYRWLKWDKSVKSFTEADLLNATKFIMLHPRHYGQPPLHKTGVFLKLNNLTADDEALYTCLATSHLGFSYRSGYLTVQHLKKSYDQQVPVASLRKEITLNFHSPSAATDVAPTKTAVRFCYDYSKNFSEVLPSNVFQCETSNACASSFDEQTGVLKMFCDKSDSCSKYNISSGDCAEVKFKSPVILCCCHDELCNQPSVKFFQKTGRSASSSKQHLMLIIFVLAIALIISLLVMLLAYRIGKRKAAMKESIVQKTRPKSRKMTKQKVMKTMWLKEDI